MRVLVVNPPITVMMNLEHHKSRGMKLFSCHSEEEALNILEANRIDLVVTFMSYSEPNIFNIVKAIMANYPGKKIIGLTSAEFSEFITSMEDIELIPARAGAPDWS